MLQLNVKPNQLYIELKGRFAMTIRTICLSVVLLFASAAATNAQWTDSKEPLRNLGGVGVWYKYDAEDLKQIGLTRSLLANDVTLRLRKAGISVLEQDDKGPHFVLNLKIFKGKEGLIVLSVSAQVSHGSACLDWETGLYILQPGLAAV